MSRGNVGCFAEVVELTGAVAQITVEVVLEVDVLCLSLKTFPWEDQLVAVIFDFVESYSFESVPEGVESMIQAASFAAADVAN